MAQRTVTVLVDDVTGKEIEAGKGHTVRFSINGIDYEIDLDDKGCKKFEEAMSFYPDHGRRVGDRATSRAATLSTKHDPAQLKAIREWANQNGHTVSGRGCNSTDIVTGYEKAHKS